MHFGRIKSTASSFSGHKISFGSCFSIRFSFRCSGNLGLLGVLPQVPPPDDYAAGNVLDGCMRSAGRGFDTPDLHAPGQFSGAAASIQKSGPPVPPKAVLHFLVVILNLTVITNFITVPLCDCKIRCFSDQLIQSILEYLALIGSSSDIRIYGDN